VLIVWSRPCRKADTKDGLCQSCRSASPPGVPPEQASPTMNATAASLARFLERPARPRRTFRQHHQQRPPWSGYLGPGSKSSHQCDFRRSGRFTAVATKCPLRQCRQAPGIGSGSGGPSMMSIEGPNPARPEMTSRSMIPRAINGRIVQVIFCGNARLLGGLSALHRRDRQERTSPA